MGTRQVDIAIVGYGIEGRMVGLSISKGFDKVVAFDTPHPLNLGADSFRNQSVLHFGIFYGENNIISAHRMLYSGEEMHKVVGLPVPQDGGILCVKEEDVEKVFAIAKKLKLSSKVRLINDYKAEKQITEFYKSGFAYLRIPETVFPEKQILERTDLLARENGLEVIRAKVTLQSHPKDTTRCLVNTGTELIEPEFLIICAGAGTPKLFEQIGIKHNLAVVCTPILRFPFDSIMSTRYFVDKSEEGLSGRGLFVVRHDLETSGTNCLVIAKSIRRLVLKDEIENKREVKDHEEEEIRKALPKSILPSRNSFGYRLIAGYKTEFVDENGQTTIDSKILDCSPYENVVAVITGKATLAYDAAEQVTLWLKQRIGKTKKNKDNNAKSQLVVQTQPVHMHYESIFDDVLDERVH